MRVGSAVRSACGTRSRGLYLVPERRVERLPHIPAGRALHLVDIENLMGGPFQGRSALSEAMSDYRSSASVQPGDHVLLAVNPAMAFEAGRAWPTAQLLMGGGPDGADHALLARVADRNWVAARYDLVVVGSGDRIFTDAVRDFRALGIAAGVVAPECGLSYRLRASASFVRLIATPSPLQIVA